MTTYFYRYLRPVQFNTQRHSPEALATGGVGFKVLKFTQTAPNDYLQKLLLLCALMKSSLIRTLRVIFLTVAHKVTCRSNLLKGLMRNP